MNKNQLNELIEFCKEEEISYDIADTPQSHIKQENDTIMNSPNTSTLKSATENNHERITQTSNLENTSQCGRTESANKTTINTYSKEVFQEITSSESRQIADSINTIEILEKEVRNFDGCTLKEMAQNTVFSDGVLESDLMIIGEAPGANEDKKGIPFCGRSGDLLDKMLASIDLSRKKNVYITNTVFWRPPNNRRPTEDELEICRPFMEKHIALINPKIILLLGSSAVYSVLKSEYSISKIRGKFYKYTNRYMNHTIPVLPSFHPSYLLRQPKQKILAWQDLQALRDALNMSHIPEDMIHEDISTY